MRYINHSIFAFLVTCVLQSCSSGSDESTSNQVISENERYDQLLTEQLVLFSSLPSEARNEANPTSAAKIKLGHFLYYDTKLSKDSNISCNSCHNLASYGVDNLATSPGDAGQHGDRSSPTTLNAAFHATQFWDGRAADVEEQAGMPILNPVEMAIPSEDFLMDRLKTDPQYQQMFSEAFPSDQNPLTYENLKRAIASFERQLITPSRVDDYLNGNKDALSLQEKKGMLSFALIGCTSCHNGPTLGGNSFQRFGVHKPYWEATGCEKIDLGRFQHTKDSADMYIFKVPTLRNIAKTAPYFHDGSIKDLGESVKLMAEIQLNYKMNKDEVKNVEAFLNALTGEVPAQYAVNPFIR